MNKKTEQEVLARIESLIIEDILQTPDEEILAEERQERPNIDESIKHTKELVTAAIIKSRKARLINAKKELTASREEKINGNILTFSFNDKKKLLKSVRDSSAGLTLAARNENEISANDIDTMLQDLIDLGVIDENGNLQ